MCLIAYQPAADAAFSCEVLENAWSANHDGAGFMLAHAGKLIVRKPFFKLKELQAAYWADHAAYGAASAFVLHFRWSTHGVKDEVNTHPQILADGKAALVHNGILFDFAPSRKSEVSDTVLFCRKVLWGRQPSQLIGRRMGRYLAEMIGVHNKLAIMDCRGNVSIVNEKAGKWDGGRWYSNDGYKAQSKRYLLPADSLCDYRYPAADPGKALPVRYASDSAGEWGRDLWEYGPAGNATPRDDRAERDAEDQALHELYSDALDSLIDAEEAAGKDREALDWDALDREAWKRVDAAMAAEEN